MLRHPEECYLALALCILLPLTPEQAFQRLATLCRRKERAVV